MRSVTGLWRWVTGALAVALLATQGTALGQTGSPAHKAPSLQGEVTGGLAAGSELSFAVDATMPGGWEALHLVEVVIRSDGQELERVRYDIEDVQVKVGDQRTVAGAGGVAAGTYLRVSGADVIVTTGGGNLSFDVVADVLLAVPDDARFELSVTDDLGTQTRVTRGLQGPAPQALTWGTIAGLIVAALFVGGFIGNLFGSKRRPPTRNSVYTHVQRRLEQERSPSRTR